MKSDLPATDLEIRSKSKKEKNTHKYIPHGNLKEVVKSLGIVFGDIGTSPTYTLAVVFSFIPISHANVLGVLSLILWTLISLVSVHYVYLAMGIGHNGEGGTIVLKENLIPLLKTKGQKRLVSFLALLAISFFIGDGVVTPAISLLSAIEGLYLLPEFQWMGVNVAISLACAIAILLFSFQKKGTETVSIAFGPIMVIWFIMLGFVGSIWLYENPAVLKAINPYYGIRFLLTNGMVGFLTLSKVILCATGGEALYTDMGHLGKKPIVKAWWFVFFVLVINYFGQGAFALTHPSKHLFYGMVMTKAPFLYIQFVVLSIVAAIIASQAMISGIFSVIYQGITTRLLPRIKVEYTSKKMRSQIYIPTINWFICIFAIIAILMFKRSYNLANAYGLAVLFTMSISGLLMCWIFALKKSYFKLATSCATTFISFSFLIASISKIPYGGYWSLFVASIPICLISIFTAGQRKLYRTLRPNLIETFVERYNEAYKKISKVGGTAVFLSRTTKKIPLYISQTMFTNNIMYESNIIVSVVTLDRPFGVKGFFKEDLAWGLKAFEIQAGYMEMVNVERVLKKANIMPKVIFYGVEDIVTNNPVWKVYALIKKLTPAFVQFYKLPAGNMHGVEVRAQL